MDLRRGDLASDLARMRASRIPATRAVGDNFAFEENIGDERRNAFEASTAGFVRLEEAIAEYFSSSVQGYLRSHAPSTFKLENGPALLPAGIAANQKIVRVECIDGWKDESWFNFAALQNTTAATSRDASVIAPHIRRLNQFAGARPAYAAFKAEVAGDLRETDWLPRLIARLGLGHCAATPGQVRYFALMEYLARDVIDGTTIDRPFVILTVLEARNSPFFYPAPQGQGFGYAADLDPHAGRDAVREFLHIRLTYRVDHMGRVGQLVGPTPALRVGALRDAHLGRLRDRSGRADYGAYMADEVDE
jgi:hypothetical protein